MSKKIILSMVAFLSLVLFANNVSAQEIYYTNSYGVSFTQEEYDFLTMMYWEGKQDLMTPADYQEFVDSDIINGEFKTASIEYEDDIMARGTYWETNAKKLNISSACTTTCYISVTLTWKTNPTIRSYDVMGAYLQNTSLTNTPLTTVMSSTGNTSTQSNQNFTNGFGVSFSLPSSGTSIIISQTYRVSYVSGAGVYASYQHATKSISLANSQNYTLSRTGYGGVFNFGEPAASTYDEMSGVNITL